MAFDFSGIDYRGHNLDFGPDFTFGTATASYQIEGAANEDGRLPSIWDTFSHTPGKVVNGDTGDVACDHYHRLDEDLDLLKSYNVDAYRFSIAWPRIQPPGTGERNQLGIDFYNRLLDGLLERGITPVVTLYHWDLPQPLEDAGGWPNRETAERFAEYAKICGEEFGDRVSQWTTLNEPFCSAYLGYSLGVHAPGRRNPVDALKAAHTLNLAHGLALQALSSVVTSDKATYSVTNNLATVFAVTDSAEDEHAAARVRAVLNGVWTGPQIHGEYPELLFETTARHTDWSFIQDGDLKNINQPIDVLGLNWYQPTTVRQGAPVDPEAEWTPVLAPGCEDVENVTVESDLTDMGWNIIPGGLESQLRDMHEEFGDLPLVITENGCSYDDPVVVEDGVRRVHDERRLDYLRQHITAAHRAKQAGVPLVGYFVWSLMDNFEWAEGYQKRFGITHVDYETLERTPKDSALWYSELAKNKVMPD